MPPSVVLQRDKPLVELQREFFCQLAYNEAKYQVPAYPSLEIPPESGRQEELKSIVASILYLEWYRGWLSSSPLGALLVVASSVLRDPVLASWIMEKAWEMARSWSQRTMAEFICDRLRSVGSSTTVGSFDSLHNRTDFQISYHNEAGAETIANTGASLASWALSAIMPPSRTFYNVSTTTASAETVYGSSIVFPPDQSRRSAFIPRLEDLAQDGP